MDLHSVTAYWQPTQLNEIGPWQPGWAWLAGGTWLFSEPQPQITTLIDMQGLGWSELEITVEGLSIGAGCVMSRLLEMPYPDRWTGITALQSAVHELASFKVQNMATIAGNLCLALPAGTFAPAMLVLGASYELLSPDGTSRQVSAATFQTGARRTILRPGEVLRKIWVPAANLEWRVNYQRLCIAAFGIALSIVVTAYNPRTHQVRVGIGACVPAPRLIEFDPVPDDNALIAALNTHIPVSDCLADELASALYRHHVTQVLMQRSLQAAIEQGNAI